ncbi:MAG: hypothetical protein GTO55_06295 [Armatimonadetes bacterium]|nr:hypothetical protein [Armatimonadota bacterium]NIM23862.1 hypothetical protein [Armatimonadota bacterium]NIM67741.1 hypothetical protein [Armatimonadota bacterium]NIM76250.1 hypothetical protein [Armatimonadota bacterium]NIN05943.1 hypothetical protein [Armatimonadota bacterium]
MVVFGGGDSSIAWKKMDYGGLIKRAFFITLRHKFLWPLGILAALPECLSSLGGGPGDTSGEDHLLLNASLNSRKDLPTIRGLDVEALAERLLENIPLLVALAFAVFILLLAIVVISTMAKGGVIASAIGIEEQEPVSFGRGFRAGYHAFWRMVGIFLLMFLLVSVSMILLAAPVIGLIITEHYWAAVGAGLPVFLILIALSIYVSVLKAYAIRFVIGHGLGIGASISDAHALMMKFKGEATLVFLIMVALRIGIVIASCIILLPLALLLAMPAILAEAAVGGIAVLVLAGVFQLIFFAVTLFLFGLVHIFDSSFWTLAFLDLSNKAEPATAILPQEPQPGISPA